jgi:hypothetical protein
VIILYIVFDGFIEKNGLLAHNTKAGPKMMNIIVFQQYSINPNVALEWLVEAN